MNLILLSRHNAICRPVDLYTNIYVYLLLNDVTRRVHVACCPDMHTINLFCNIQLSSRSCFITLAYRVRLFPRDLCPARKEGEICTVGNVRKTFTS
jgi:hypothetical protein